MYFFRYQYGILSLLTNTCNCILNCTFITVMHFSELVHMMKFGLVGLRGFNNFFHSCLAQQQIN